jgi:antitoxin HicB
MRHPIDVKPDGKFSLATFPDIPEAITQGKSLKVAKEVATSALEPHWISISRTRELSPSTHA